MSSRALLVMTTCPNSSEAEALAAQLVERRLAACVNTLEGVGSTYRWEGKVQQARESLLLIKTTEARFEALAQAIRARASYELPEVLAVPVHMGSADYLAWLEASVAGEE